MKLVENFDIKQIERNVQDDLKDKDISKLIQDDENKKNECITNAINKYLFNFDDSFIFIREQGNIFYLTSA